MDNLTFFFKWLTAIILAIMIALFLNRFRNNKLKEAEK